RVAPLRPHRGRLGRYGHDRVRAPRPGRSGRLAAPAHRPPAAAPAPGGDGRFAAIGVVRPAGVRPRWPSVGRGTRAAAGLTGTTIHPSMGNGLDTIFK